MKINYNILTNIIGFNILNRVESEINIDVSNSDNNSITINNQYLSNNNIPTVSSYRYDDTQGPSTQTPLTTNPPSRYVYIRNIQNWRDLRTKLLGEWSADHRLRGNIGGISVGNCEFDGEIDANRCSHNIGWELIFGTTRADDDDKIYYYKSYLRN